MLRSVEDEIEEEGKPASAVAAPASSPTRPIKELSFPDSLLVAHTQADTHWSGVIADEGSKTF